MNYLMIAFLILATTSIILTHVFMYIENRKKPYIVIAKDLLIEEKAPYSYTDSFPVNTNYCKSRECAAPPYILR